MEGWGRRDATCDSEGFMVWDFRVSNTGAGTSCGGAEGEVMEPWSRVLHSVFFVLGDLIIYYFTGIKVDILKC